MHSAFTIPASKSRPYSRRFWPVLAGIQQQHLLDASAQVVEIGARLVHGVGVLVLLLLSQVFACSVESVSVGHESILSVVQVQNVLVFVETADHFVAHFFHFSFGPCPRSL